MRAQNLDNRVHAVDEGQSEDILDHVPESSTVDLISSLLGVNRRLMTQHRNIDYFLDLLDQHTKHNWNRDGDDSLEPFAVVLLLDNQVK